MNQQAQAESVETAHNQNTKATPEQNQNSQPVSKTGLPLTQVPLQNATMPVQNGDAPADEAPREVQASADKAEEGLT